MICECAGRLSDVDGRAFGRSELAATPAFVSHPRIAERAHALKLARVIVAEPTDAGLIASLLQYFDADS